MTENFSFYYPLIQSLLVPVVISVTMYLIKEKTKFRKLSYVKQQIIIGIIFGVVAIFATDNGVDFNGATANTRDAAPLCAGLIFGGPSGIIAGLIGGIDRWFAVYRGAGEYSRIACSLSTALAGLYAALLRKYILGKKMPTFPVAFVTGLVAEVIHLTILFLTHMTDPEQSVKIVESLAIPMILTNSIAVSLSVFIIYAIKQGKIEKKTKKKSLSQLFQTPMLIAIALAYFASTLFTYQLQTYSAKQYITNLIKLNIDDIKTDYSEFQDETLFKVARRIGQTGIVFITDSKGNLISGEDTSDSENKITTDVFENIELEPDTVTEVKEPGNYFILQTTVEGYTITAVVPSEEAYSNRDTMTYINSFMEVLVFAGLFILIFLIIRRVVVNNMHKANDGLNKIIEGDLDTKIDIYTSEEFESLSNDINHTVDTLKKYIADAESRIDMELKFAKQIQHSVLPSEFPKTDKFGIYATMNTAKEVGGDFYDFYMPDENHIAFLVADVSGKGIPAAMFMMTAKTMLKNLAETGIAVNEVFNSANNKLCEGNDTAMFVTAWMGILDINTGELQYANAGHNPPLVKRNEGKFEFLKSPVGLVLAGIEDTQYKLQTVTLNPGDGIFLYTDGVTEAADKNGNFYGEERLTELVNSFSITDEKIVLQSVKEDIDEFAKGADQADDITMLMLNYIPDTGRNKITVKEYPATDESFPIAAELIEELLNEAGASDKTLMQFSVAFEEMFINIAHYAYPSGEEGTVKLEAGVEGDYFCVTLSDMGIPFDPFAREDPDLTETADEKKIGGLGIYMTKQFTDEATYSHDNGMNIVTLKKKLH